MPADILSLNLFCVVCHAQHGPEDRAWAADRRLARSEHCYHLRHLVPSRTPLRGLSEVEPDWLDLVRALKGSQWQVFTKVQLPGSLPYIFSGMKVAAILAIAGAVVGNSSVPSVASASS